MKNYNYIIIISDHCVTVSYSTVTHSLLPIFHITHCEKTVNTIIINIIHCIQQHFNGNTVVYITVYGPSLYSV